ncbi:hypothetical protein [Reyranella massiliensis]|jgi:hypothetical protein|uniref:hypothetical protein n=1 Tax=Reyranella massiliensis TaxID=445220 RepID=UPI0002F4AFD8|nr:hypothetical protein [Reyranella massiliensis]
MTTRWTIGLLVGAGLLVLAGANTHLVWVAVTSQPDCVDHVKRGEQGARSGSFTAARSACSGAKT